jgi:hypothetical protein
MAPPRQVVIEADIRALMGEVDEGVWKEEGLFTMVDSLGECTKSLNHTTIDLTSPQARSHSSSFGAVPPSSDFLPGLFVTPSVVEIHSPVSGLREEARGASIIGFRRKVGRTIGSTGVA